MSNSKLRLIKLLLTLYPEQWRQEYGDELSGLLEARPLRLQIFLNVGCGALVQHWHDGEPWFLVGVLCMSINLIQTLIYFSFGIPIDLEAALWGKQAFWSGVFSIAVLFTVGFWTALRSNKAGSRPGQAAIKTALVSSLFPLVVTVLTLVHAVPVIVVGLNGAGHPFAFVYRDSSSASHISLQFLAWVCFWSCLLNLPFAGLLGFLGGITGQLTLWATKRGRAKAN